MKIKIIVVLAMLTLVSCHKFLDVTPKGIVMPSKEADYDGLLNSPVLTQAFAPELLYMTDDVYVYTLTSSTATTANAYLWRTYINAESQNSPAIWGSLYNAIYFTNVIINGVLNATDGTAAQKQQTYSEALFMRAYCYLDLLTVFAKAYNPATAATDPGLPMVTSTDVGEVAPQRSSVQAVLDALTADLTKAAANLPATNTNKYRVTKYAAYALLSRIALYKADYTNARAYAEQALSATHTILNYNNYTALSGIPKSAANPEVIYQRTSSNYTIPFQVQYSEDLISYFGTQPYATSPDLRFRYFSVGYSDGISRTTADGTYANWGISFPEMDLTRAEAIARGGDASGAMAIINMLRKNRIATAAYTDLTATSGPDALTLVLAERRRELAFSGLRWFDMKRLDRDGRMPDVPRINHAVAATSTPAQQIDLLPARSPRYTFQIPARVLLFNPGMIKNN